MNLLKIHLKLMVSAKWPGEGENLRPAVHEVHAVRPAPPLPPPPAGLGAFLMGHARRPCFWQPAGGCFLRRHLKRTLEAVRVKCTNLSSPAADGSPGTLARSLVLLLPL